MNESVHHVGEWELATVVVALPDGTVAKVPFLARDLDSAAKCVRLSLALLGYPLIRTGVGE